MTARLAEPAVPSDGETVYHRMPDKLHAQLRNPLRIPILLEWENTQKQIAVSGELFSAARAPRPKPAAR